MFSKGSLPIDASSRGHGRRPEANRSIINGIVWRLRCGTPWRDVPPKYGNWNTIYRRWSDAGVWESVSVTLAEIMADSGHYSIDSTTVRAHVLAAGGKEDLSKSSWPLAFHLTVGETADCKAYGALIAMSEKAPGALLADKGYDADAIRADLAERGMRL